MDSGADIEVEIMTQLFGTRRRGYVDIKNVQQATDVPWIGVEQLG